jgi:hypothetical protein
MYNDEIEIWLSKLTPVAEALYRNWLELLVENDQAEIQLRLLTILQQDRQFSDSRIDDEVEIAFRLHSDDLLREHHVVVETEDYEVYIDVIETVLELVDSEDIETIKELIDEYGNLEDALAMYVSQHLMKDPTRYLGNIKSVGVELINLLQIKADERALLSVDLDKEIIDKKYRDRVKRYYKSHANKDLYVLGGILKGALKSGTSVDYLVKEHLPYILDNHIQPEQYVALLVVSDIDTVDGMVEAIDTVYSKYIEDPHLLMSIRERIIDQVDIIHGDNNG